MTRLGKLAPIVLGFATACGGGSGGAGSRDTADAAGHDAIAADSAAPTTVTADVETDRGPVHGVPTGDLVVFRGIPFAAPPTGALRFAPPQPAAPWTAPLDATAFAPACPQTDANLTVQSEDCLHVNVWAHASVPEPRPVIVWIHGGGYVQGDASEAAYDGVSLADHADAIVITIDYRLGLLGFLASPVVAAPDGGTGNWGLRDQIAALEWVHRNATAFGGDPARVMIAGESAGAISICTLLAAPGAQGLFASAALESGTCRAVLDASTTNGTWPSAQTMSADALTALGCATADCLRATPSSALVTAQANLPSGVDLGFFVGSTLPVVDGVVLDQRPAAAIAAGRGAVPLITGANHDDASGFLIPLGLPNTPGTFDTYLGDLGLGSDEAALDALYPVATLGEVGAAIAYSTDVAFACPAWQLARARTAPTYLYELERGLPDVGAQTGYGATHGLDFAYLFDTLIDWGVTATADDTALTATMQTAWGAVAHGEAPASWTAATGPDPSYLALDGTSTLRTSWRGGRCAELAALGLLAE